jgi:hypothetical protein
MPEYETAFSLRYMALEPKHAQLGTESSLMELDRRCSYRTMRRAASTGAVIGSTIRITRAQKKMTLTRKTYTSLAIYDSFAIPAIKQSLIFKLLADNDFLAQFLPLSGPDEFNRQEEKMDSLKPKSYSFSGFSIRLHAPAKSGVYYLHNSAQCIYVGETENIRRALLGHLHGDVPWITIWSPTGFCFEACSETSRVQQKNELTMRLRPAVKNRAADVDESSARVKPHDMRLPFPLS